MPVDDALPGMEDSAAKPSRWPGRSTSLHLAGATIVDAVDGEKFGNAMIMSDGHLAPNGFIALANLDSNHDRVIDARDARFNELRPTNIVSISLDTHLELRCDADHNCQGERASFTWRDDGGTLRTGTVIDVYGPRLY